MNHELWLEPDGCQTFCLPGEHGNGARTLLHPEAKLVWKVKAKSHFDAMTRYYSYMNWGEYQTNFPEQDKISYKELGWGDSQEPSSRYAG